MTVNVNRSVAQARSMKETMIQQLVLNDLATMWSPSHRGVTAVKKRQ